MNVHEAVLYIFTSWQEAAKSHPDRFKGYAVPSFNQETGVVKVRLAPACQIAAFVGRDKNWLRLWNLVLSSINDSPVAKKHYLDVLFEIDPATKRLKIYQYVREISDSFTESVLTSWDKHVEECGGHLEPENKTDNLLKDIRTVFLSKDYVAEEWQRFMEFAKYNDYLNGSKRVERDGYSWVPNLRSVFRDRGERGVMLFEAVGGGGMWW